MKASRENSSPAAPDRRRALDCRPVKNPEVIAVRKETGEVLLTYPVTLRPWIDRLYKRLFRAPPETRMKKIQLDELGTAVWDLLDGARTVNQVIRRFAREFKVQHSEAEVSVTRFLRELGRRGLIGLD